MRELEEERKGKKRYYELVNFVFREKETTTDQ